MKNFDISAAVVTHGNELESLAMHAINASQWLAAGVPDTKPKSMAELIEDAAASTYALFNGHTVGHIATTAHAELFALCFGSAREGMDYKDVPHFTIESLAVKPDMKGMGIGGLMLETALGDIAAQVGAGQEKTTLAVVSALACNASLPLFQKFGFSEFAYRNDDLEFYEPFKDIDLVAAQAHGKNIVSTVLVVPPGA